MSSTDRVCSTPLVSVIITCYNCEKTILRAVQSVLDQSYKNLEVIVIDDCSTDQSHQVLLSLSDSRCEVISKQNNEGVSRARNAGYERANGDFVTQLDGDDYMHPDKIKNEVEASILHRGSAVFSRYVVVQDGKRVIKFGDLLRKSRQISPVGILYRTEYAGRDWLIPANVLNGLAFDEGKNLYEDWKFAVQIARRCNVIFIDQVGTYYIKYNKTLSVRPWKDHRTALNTIFFELSNDKLARFIFFALNHNKFINKFVTAFLNWTKAYKFFPE